MISPRDVSPGRFQNPDRDPRGPYLLADITAPGERPTLTYAWRGVTPPPGRHWRYAKERAEQFEADHLIVWDRAGARPRIKRFLAEGAEPDESSPTDFVTVALRTLLHALAQAVVADPEYLGRVEWRDLERLLGQALATIGFDVTVTRPGRDGGFDLLLTCKIDGETRTYLAETKHWRAPSRPGPGVLRSFMEVVVNNRVDGGLLLSSSGFSSPALRVRSEIDRQRVSLGGQDKIVGLCQTYLLRMEGVWAPTTTLPEILFAGTF